MKQSLGEEVKPLSEFPENAASFLAQVRNEPKAHVYSDKPPHKCGHPRSSLLRP